MIDEVRERLIKYIQDAHALEQHVAHQLEEMIERAEEPEMQELLRRHTDETRQHAERLRERLAAYNEGPSPVKQVGSLFAALREELIDGLRPPNPARDARDAYVAEHMEIGTYELLKHMAEHAGDWATAGVARSNLAEEHEMADAIAARWEDAVHATLRAEHIAV